MSRLIQARYPLSRFWSVALSRNVRFLSTESNKTDEPFKVEEAETVNMPPPPTEKYLPLDFAKSNRLMNRKCEMVLKDETQRCWLVWLGRAGCHFGIIHGWTKFRAENGLRVGDAYKFGLIKNGEIPIAQFHFKYSGKVAKREEQRSMLTI